MFAHNFTEKKCTTSAFPTGLIAGTLIESAKGWLPVQDLRIGDAVHSYDGGLVRVFGLDRQWYTPNRTDYLVQLPGGALDNCSDLTLIPHQNLLIDTLGDACLPDAMVALIPASALDGWLGAHRRAFDKPIEVITPRFGDDEAIFANSGTLLHCPDIRQNPGAATSEFFMQLDRSAARSLLQRIYGNPDQSALRYAA